MDITNIFTDNGMEPMFVLTKGNSSYLWKQRDRTKIYAAKGMEPIFVLTKDITNMCADNVIEPTNWCQTNIVMLIKGTHAHVSGRFQQTYLQIKK